MSSFSDFFFGSPERFEQRSTISPQQQQLLSQLLQALQGGGAGGAFGDTADYFRGLLSGQGQDVDAFIKPEQRRFREEILPEIATNFAGQGSGALSSSAFRNASVNSGTDLAERVARIRAELRQSGAQGLSQLGQQGLGNYTENIFRPRQAGAADQLIGVGGRLAAQYLTGGLSEPAFAAANVAQGISQGSSIAKGSTQPYGGVQPGINNGQAGIGNIPRVR